MKVTRRSFVTATAAGYVLGKAAPSRKSTSAERRLSPAHIAAVNRRRRVIVNYDTGSQGYLFDRRVEGADRKQVIMLYFNTPSTTNIISEGSQVDSIFWNFGEGNVAYWPSKVLPVIDLPGWRKWFDEGFDLLGTLLEETHQRGLEAFFSYRINGSDFLNEDGSFQTPTTKPLFKAQHPEWLLHAWNKEITYISGFLNYAIREVRDYKVSVLREVAENYNFDGIEIDFARITPVLPIGHQWENREHLTQFMRAMRLMTLEVEEKRGRPFLLAARIPENLEGCHFDGMEVETWAREGLVDVLVLGCRSFDVDLRAFHRITAGTGIKLYPALDDHHASDGYEHPSIEVLRGVFANWWEQGADGIQTFNWSNTSREVKARSGIWKKEDLELYWKDPFPRVWALHRQAYQEMGSPETLKGKDKGFVVQRRGGGHGPQVIANPDDWWTPRWMYFNTNMFGALPAALANDGKADALLFVYIADDFNALADRIKRVRVRILLSDPEAEVLPLPERLVQVLMASHGQVPDHLAPNIPAARGIENQIELRVNNILLRPPSVEGGWLVFEAQPRQFAVGNNLVGMRLTERSPKAQSQVLIEMLEVHVDYS